MATIPCPHCGADILSDASFCRHCGSSDSDGWRDDAWDSDSSDDDGFDYDEYVQQNHGSELTNRSIAPMWRLVTVLLLLSFIAWALLAFR